MPTSWAICARWGRRSACAKHNRLTKGSDHMARRRRRHRRKGRFAFLYKLMTFLLICGALVAALALFFKVESIEITGTSRYSTDEVERASGVHVGDNLYLMDKNAVASRITQQLPYVETVQISPPPAEDALHLRDGVPRSGRHRAGRAALAHQRGRQARRYRARGRRGAVRRRYRADARESRAWQALHRVRGLRARRGAPRDAPARAAQQGYAHGRRAPST